MSFSLGHGYPYGRFMMRLLTFLSVLVLLVTFGATAVQSQDWEVDGHIELEDLGDPGSESDNSSLQNQSKVETYTPLLEILVDNSNIGFCHVDYEKDSDPYGDFVITVTSTSVGFLSVVYTLRHECIDVSIGSLEMISSLSVELIDLGDPGVQLTATGGMIAPGVEEEDGLGTTDRFLPTLILGNDEILNGAGTTNYNSGVQNFVGTNTTVAMILGGSFQLSPEDKVILRGRFEIAHTVPVESATWGKIKALYTE